MGVLEDAEALGTERSERKKEATDLRSRLEEVRVQVTESRKEVSSVSIALRGMDLNDVKREADDIRSLVHDLADTSALQGQKLQELSCSFERLRSMELGLSP